MSKKVHLLVIAPHTDDTEFGIAGTVAKWVREGKSAAYVICTNGDKGTSDVELDPQKLIKMREEEQRQAAKTVGVDEVVFLGYRDQELEDTTDFRRDIVRWIRTYQPEVVATTDPYHRYIWHRDHRMTGIVTLDAVYPYARDHLAYPDLFTAGFKPHKVREVLTWGSDEPNYWSDISDTIDLKIAALRCHYSQLGARFDMLEKGIKERAADMAKGQNCKYTEAFHRILIRM
jgi:LmbE family N-acetylglucosaminyl deacetylase